LDLVLSDLIFEDGSPQQCSLPFSTPQQISGLDLPRFTEQHTGASNSRTLVYEWL